MPRLGSCHLWQLAEHGGLATFGQQLRKPWVILSDARSRLEQSLGLSYGELLQFLSQQLQSSVALAHVSGNVYLGPQLEDLKMSGEQVLVANLFSHGEIGVDAIASPSAQPDADTLRLLRCIATYPKLRWIHGVDPVVPRESEAATSDANGGTPSWGEVVKPVKRSLMKKHPLLRELMGDLDTPGTCLQHSNFIHHDIQGDSLEECQISAARIAAKRAYGEAGRGGCALLTSSGFILSGSEISNSISGITPLQVALVSLGANGLCPSTVLSVAYAGQVGQLLGDEKLREQVIPQAALRVVDLE
ncbi:unnamed protein product [Cladocopium goreaui]|uniref:Cytidine/deoxycytidylate deaminase zinc-binding domain-containing protein n=1 Tax=Cladocopium goreaui TaxID=2562237 RepID=A0A9P1CTF5_9DINO|nr:unnamed protein product [Cladocopium goreaui]